VYASQELPVGNPCRGEENVIRVDQIVRRERLVDLESRLLGDTSLLIVTRPELSLIIPADALQRCCRDHGFWRPADTH
jgi:hypothetical protein